ncbi:hypothetical protein EDB83DRAFT_2395610, partial [Lactarius deliciosus]
HRPPRRRTLFACVISLSLSDAIEIWESEPIFPSLLSSRVFFRDGALAVLLPPCCGVIFSPKGLRTVIEPESRLTDLTQIHEMPSCVRKKNSFTVFA